MFMVPFGAQSAACALIGEKIGANQVGLARMYLKVIAVLTTVLMLSVQLAVLLFKDSIVDGLTEELHVRAHTKTSITILVLGFAPDFIQGTL